MPRILLVEDDSELSNVLSRFLQNNGYQVDAALDGLEAVEKLRSSKPDLIITDLSVPKVSGWELCKASKQDPATSRIPILVITGTRRGALEELMSLECGADEYIVKPFALDELLRTIQRWLGSSPN